MVELNVKGLIGVGAVMATEAYICYELTKGLVKEVNKNLLLKKKITELELELRKYEKTQEGA